MNFCVPNASAILIIVGSVVVVIGAVLLQFLPGVLNLMIQEKLVLSSTSDMYEKWRVTPIPIYLQFYIFNYTNVPDFIKSQVNGTRPQVQQAGPYTYLQTKEKVEIAFSEDLETVKYHVRKHYFFVPEMSAGSEDDLIIVPNVPLTTFVNKLPQEDIPDDVFDLLLPGFPKHSYFVKCTVGNFLFYGYMDYLLRVLSTVGIETNPENKFALLYGKNGSLEGPFEVSTGKNDIKKLGQIMKYDDNSTVAVWSGSSCNMINGTDGTMFAPGTPKTDRLYVFSPEMCRSLYLSYQSEVIHHGLKAYRYVTTMEGTAEVGMNPENECFCIPENKTDCLPSGVLNLEKCKNDAPLYMSAPNFLYADSSFRNAIDGLDFANVDEHGTYLHVEPTVGVVVNASRRIQTNIKFKNLPWLRNFNFFSDILLPLLWINETACFDYELTQKLMDKLSTVVAVGIVIPYVIIGLGCGLAFLGVLCSTYLMYEKQSQVKPTMEKIHTIYVN